MKCIIVGAGGHGRVVLDALRAGGRHSPLCFVDENPTLRGKFIDGVPVSGDLADFLFDKSYLGGPSDQQVKAVIAIGDNTTRLQIAATLAMHGMMLGNAIHPTATISKSAVIHQGIVIAAGAIVCAHAQLGDHVIVNTGAIVDHECAIYEGAHICPGASLAGRVTIDRGAFIVLNASVIQNVKIGEFAVVGAGAVVLSDVPAHTTVVGVPARPITRRPHEEADSK